MIKLIVLILLMVQMSCSSIRKTSIFELAGKTKNSIVKKSAAATKEEADRIIQNRINYLTLLFEQTRDPYYGQPKWTDQCLKSNKIGSMTNSELISVSELYVDGEGNPGFCPENPFAIRAYEVFFYCEKEKIVYQITIPSKDALDLKKVALCR